MLILVLNSGSSSIKFQLLSMPSGTMMCSGFVERIGNPGARFYLETTKGEYDKEQEVPGHQKGLEIIATHLTNPELGLLQPGQKISAVGHRVVHGGKFYAQTVKVTQIVKEKIKELASLAPLHNPNNLLGIEVSEQLFPEAEQVAVFDTAFHQSIPEKAYRYAIPNVFYDDHGIRVYGFHGTSHKYVSERASEYLGRIPSRMITIHLGNGCSITAIRDGKSVDHSLGFGPSNGLIMGTRSGDIDHALIFYLLERGYTAEELNQILVKESGMYGLTRLRDLRDIQSAAEKGDRNSILALDMMSYRIRKYIGAYAAAMNGLDVLVFTAGIGENSALVREQVCGEMDYLGLEIDPDKNQKAKRGICEVQSFDGRVKILIVPTNEELEIARQTYQLLK
ncbi:acetate/propionate family kinase [Lentiprolixibacter aurantiacus]|uniref:Acetate kinase n=1 Tax=Lentiprolixibacter aurantiacus TaxID=2993939 RepID=A0AAE3SPK0_9FLAO|nr:acetate kinase [Lentiprolixibacter aurantiacus]MCX2720749.1 acetate kinase [Lentiprolixibacter aurantiacus]